MIKEYGVLYAKVTLPTQHKQHWLGHCALFNILPKDLKEEIIRITNYINTEWADSIFIPMDVRIMPGIVTTPEAIEGVANDIYNEMNAMMKKLIGEDNCIRVVYGVGKFDEEHMEYVKKEFKTAHMIGNYPIMVKVGRTLDNEWTPGIYRVSV